MGAALPCAWVKESKQRPAARQRRLSCFKHAGQACCRQSALLRGRRSAGEVHHSTDSSDGAQNQRPDFPVLIPLGLDNAARRVPRRDARRAGHVRGRRCGCRRGVGRAAGRIARRDALWAYRTSGWVAGRDARRCCGCWRENLREEIPNAIVQCTG